MLSLSHFSFSLQVQIPNGDMYEVLETQPVEFLHEGSCTCTIFINPGKYPQLLRNKNI
jgi:hypothetical protein